MSDATALSRATAYPLYDPAAAVQAYVDEFGTLELAGWVALGITLAIVVWRVPATASPARTTAASPEASRSRAMIETRSGG